MCPHMLRYAGAVFLLNKKLKPMTKDLVHVLQQDKQNYSDPVTSFLLALHQDLDFEETKLQLDQMQVLCENDYFLHGANAETIMSNARLAIFTIYCRYVKKYRYCVLYAASTNHYACDAAAPLIKMLVHDHISYIDSFLNIFATPQDPPIG